MMYVSDKGCAYANSHFTLTDGNRIRNNFTGKILGICVSTKQIDNYMCCDPRFNKPLTTWQKIKRWFREEQLKVDHQMKEDAAGSLVDTMKGLPSDSR